VVLFEISVSSVGLFVSGLALLVSLICRTSEMVTGSFLYQTSPTDWSIISGQHYLLVFFMANSTSKIYFGPVALIRFIFPWPAVLVSAVN
jgi:hypothetical protein